MQELLLKQIAQYLFKDNWKYMMDESREELVYTIIFNNDNCVL